jgi:hypothetical protein
VEDRSRRSALAVGVLLIVLGVLFLAGQLFPGLFSWVGQFTWPLIVVGVGVFLFILGLLVGTPDMAVPACIVGGIGLLLYWQNATGNWESWAYVWTLIPGFAGLGTILAGILKGDGKAARGGLWTVFISIVGFVIFSSIFRPMFGQPALLGQYWPLLVILLGVLLLFQALFRSRRAS